MDQELVRASLAGDLIEVRRLLSRGSNPNTERMYRTPLNLAAEMNRVSVVRELLLNGANQFPNNKYDGSALYYAAKHGNLDVIRELLSDRRYDPNIFVDISGDNILFWACLNDKLEVVKILLTDGRMNPNFINKFGQTPLHKASEKGNLEIVKELLFNGADVTITDKQGETPLHIASQSGHANVVKELLLNGADPNTLNNYDHNSLYYTIVNRNNQHFPEYIRDGCAEIVEILETYFPSLQALAMRSIRRNRIDITKIPPNLYSS